MKFFWKIFFAILFVSGMCVSLCGALLIGASFRRQLNSQVETAKEYGEIVCYSLADEYAAVQSEREENVAETVKNIASRMEQSIQKDGMSQQIAFAVLNQQGERLYSSLKTDPDGMVTESLDDHTAVWALKKNYDGVLIQSMRPVTCQDRIFYIETVRDVTRIFQDRKNGYKLMLCLLAGMILFAGVLSFLLSKWLLRPVAELTEITKTISAGNLQERAGEQGKDEIAELSRNFNRMADRLEDKIQELHQEAKRKELFVGAFSHELKTPLTSIIGYADLLQQKELSTEERQLCARYIFSEGKRLETLSMRLLELIVLKNRQIFPKPVQIDLLLEQLAEQIRPELSQVKIRLSCKAEPAVVCLEPELMETVFQNLIDNGRKAIEKEGWMILTGENRPEGYVVVLEDSGKGMKEEELAKITEAFYMVDRSRARKQGGAGLGLALCKEILILHGFDLAFASAPGKGTRVTVTMKPAVLCQEDPEKKEAEHGQN